MKIEQLNKPEPFKLTGYIKLDIYDKYGALKDTTGWKKNTITTAGMAQMALLGGVASAVPFTYLAVGVSATAPSAAATALVSEITGGDLARTTATVSRVTTDNSNDTLQLYKQWTASATHAIEEAGIFNASAAGTMLGRALTTTKTVNDTETMTLTYKVKMS